MPVSDLLQPVLERYWGFTSFRPLQREAMHAILAGRDSVVVLPTGGGKSLCFQAPAVVDALAGSKETRPTIDRDDAEGTSRASPDAGSRRTRSTTDLPGGQADVGRVLLDPPEPERRGVALVISPLISLMKDQVDGLRVDGVAAAFLNSTLAPHERDEVLASIRDDRCRLLYVSPERIV